VSYCFSGDQFAVVPWRGKAANPESSGELGTLGWIPDSRFAASGMTTELISRISCHSGWMPKTFAFATQ
jgi:hypothetical protein